jgi:hypothetical protein
MAIRNVEGAGNLNVVGIVSGGGNGKKAVKNRVHVEPMLELSQTIEPRTYTNIHAAPQYAVGIIHGFFLMQIMNQAFHVGQKFSTPEMDGFSTNTTIAQLIERKQNKSKIIEK